METAMQTAVDFLREHNDYLILTHKNPDGDAVGCAVALCLALRRAGKRAHIFKNYGFTPRFTPYLRDLCVEPEDASQRCVIAVDIADEKLFPKNALPLAPQVELAIDHHQSHKPYARNTLVDAHAAACGELIYRVIGALELPIDRDIAEALYVAISTDTSCFLNSNTTPDTHRIVADLMEAGVDFSAINRVFFVLKTKNRLEIESRLIHDMAYYAHGRIALMKITRDLLRETRATEDDLDNISALTRSIDGVELGILIRELSDGTSKVSMRSSELVNVAEVCSHFGGGGHARAAGCSIPAPPDAAEKILIDQIFLMKIL